MEVKVKPNQSILLIEDSADDYEVTMRVFKKVNFNVPVHRCPEGDDALDYLYRRGSYANPVRVLRPSLILLDLNLPGLDGREVLATIKSDAELKQIPVIVLTTSSDERDIQYCYQYGVNSYIQKAVAMEQILITAQRLKEYWFETVLLPKLEAPI